MLCHCEVVRPEKAAARLGSLMFGEIAAPFDRLRTRNDIR
jgi:hypothetical protein